MTQAELNSEITHLSDQINRHNSLYYQRNSPEISWFDSESALERNWSVWNQFQNIICTSDSQSQRFAYALPRFQNGQHSTKMPFLGKHLYHWWIGCPLNERVEKRGVENYMKIFCEMEILTGMSHNQSSHEMKLARAGKPEWWLYKVTMLTENVKTDSKHSSFTHQREGVPIMFEVRGRNIFTH